MKSMSFYSFIVTMAMLTCASCYTPSAVTPRKPVSPSVIKASVLSSLPPAPALPPLPDIPAVPLAWENWTTNDTARFWTYVLSDANHGEVTECTPEALGILESFGSQYMPNVYKRFETARQKALERELMVKESGVIDETLRQKVIKAVSKADAESCRWYDELCLLHLFHLAGIITAEELAVIDENNMPIMVP